MSVCPRNILLILRKIFKVLLFNRVSLRISAAQNFKRENMTMPRMEVKGYSLVCDICDVFVINKVYTYSSHKWHFGVSSGDTQQAHILFTH